MWWILVLVVAVVLSYLKLIRPYKYWTNKGVLQTNPVPLLGDNFATTFRLQCFSDFFEDNYNMYPDARYMGFYQFVLPCLMLRDPDLIKQITVRDSDHFVDHREFISEDIDPLWARNLFALNGQRWRDMRSTLSPSFTTSKMKYLFSLISQTGERFTRHFLKKNEDLITMEMKDAFTRFSNDVIANTIFGSECDSLEEPTNEFFMMGRETTDFTGFRKMVRFFGYIILPSLYKYFNIRLFSQEVGDFFERVVKGNIETRERHGIERPDMLNLLLQVRNTGLQYEETGEKVGKSNGQKLKITDEDITSQALLFFFGGYETVSILMSFMSYELALNPDVQERLIQEVDDTLAACNGKITYEALHGMQYLDMVVSEALRRWPTANATDRLCTKPYTIQPKTPDERPIHLDEKTCIVIPIVCIHRDPRYWPEPQRFDPERFSDENKKNIKPYTYFPFGLGPRHCIGSRFALMETKTLFFYVLAHFNIVPVEQTQVPLRLSRKKFTLAAENGIWLGFKRRRIVPVM